MLDFKMWQESKFIGSIKSTLFVLLVAIYLCSFVTFAGISILT